MPHAGDSANMPLKYIKHILASHGGARSLPEEITCHDLVSSVSLYVYGSCLYNESKRTIRGRDSAYTLLQTPST